MMDIRYNIELPLFSVSFLRQIPDSVVKLSEKQFLVLIRFQTGKEKFYRVVQYLFRINFFLAFIVCKRKFWAYKLSECLSHLCDFTKPADRMLIRNIPGTVLFSPGEKFKGVTFLQFMFVDTMYSHYLQTKQKNHLYSFIAALYLKKGELFSNMNMKNRLEYLEKAIDDSSVTDAIVINYMMMKKWLEMSYPYMFTSNNDMDLADTVRKQKWLDIFDAFVGEQIPNTEYYKNMACMDAFRIINRRMKNYYNGKN